MSKYKITETDADLPLMAKTLGISEITARVMANRGIRSKKTAVAFLLPRLESMIDPFLLTDMERAVEIIKETAAKRERVIVYGDYDADGVMGTVILLKALRQLGADAECYIPHRTEEGYGLNMNAVRRIAEGDEAAPREAGDKPGDIELAAPESTGGKAAGRASLLLAVDNGISAIKEVEEANRLGLRVVILDHHEPGFTETGADVLPGAAAIVDPKQARCGYPFKSLCAAGLAYKLAAALGVATDEMLALAAIATLCDIVELTDENRVIVKRGLEVLNRNKLINPGLGSLITCRGYLDKPLDEFAVGFVLGPCINATGRLESANLAVNLLMARPEDAAERFILSEKLTQLNDERKNLTQETFLRAMETVQKDKLDKVLVLVDADAHESVAGIVAGRLRDAVNRPTLLLTRGDGAMKGSGRSVEGYNLFEALYGNRHLFLRFGGHAMAAGLTLPEENIEPLRQALNDGCALTEEDFLPVLTIDQALDADEVSLNLAEELLRLAPFGKGNREPLFAGFGVAAEQVRAMDGKKTILFTFMGKNKRRVKGIAFGLNEKFHERYGSGAAGMTLDIAFSVEKNVYNGVASAQIRVRGFL